MELLLENESDFDFSVEYISIVEKIVLKTLELENYHDNIEISILIVDNEEIKKMNYKFRGINNSTDVLSFPLIDLLDLESEFELGTKVFLGDIVISIEKAIEQGKEFNHSLQREIAFLVAHSMLHLLGYDHVDGEKEMFDKQKHILEEAGFPR